MAPTLSIRVTVLDTWDQIPLEVSPTTSVAEVKGSALLRSRVKGDAADFVLKFKGAELYEEGSTMADAGVGTGAALIALRRRRTPVR